MFQGEHRYSNIVTTGALAGVCGAVNDIRPTCLCTIAADEAGATNAATSQAATN